MCVFMFVYLCILDNFRTCFARQEGRPSTYQRIPVDRTAIFTDYKSRVLSRLTLGGSKSPSVAAKSPGTELKKDRKDYHTFH